MHRVRQHQRRTCRRSGDVRQVYFRDGMALEQCLSWRWSAARAVPGACCLDGCREQLKSAGSGPCCRVKFNNCQRWAALSFEVAERPGCAPFERAAALHMSDSSLYEAVLRQHPAWVPAPAVSRGSCCSGAAPSEQELHRCNGVQMAAERDLQLDIWKRSACWAMTGKLQDMMLAKTQCDSLLRFSQAGTYRLGCSMRAPSSTCQVVLQAYCTLAAVVHRALCGVPSAMCFVREHRVD